MKKRFEWVEIFLVIAISVFILAHPAYLCCAKLLQTKFTPSDLSFENPDQEDRLPDNEKELKMYGPSTLLIMFLLGMTLFNQPFYLSRQALSFRQRIVVLRC